MPDMTSFMKSDMEAACRPSDASFADQVELPDSEEGHLEEAPWIGDSRIRILLAITIPLEVLLMVIKLMVVAYVSSEPYYVDALNYTAAIVRNVALLIHIPRIPEHTEHPTHFSTRRVLSEAFVGAPSVLLLELGVAAALSISLEIVALAHGEESLGIQVWLYIMQSTNFVVLFSLIMRMEQGWARLHRICRWQQGLQVAFIVYDIILHIIVMTRSNTNHDFRDFRIASLASLIALRLLCYRFFQFKADEPENWYTRPLHTRIKIQ
eukprot:TRINITY_DN17161_c0_g1_i1.p1 TRINITY_DN17161_c0_g1~~TRINITY_DN17161_c0_g1_i1.p1  ORF type:complete len:266 (-),score=57.42 TRINITY_DN17161_c0_g1_i1:282-1079(-)